MQELEKLKSVLLDLNKNQLRFSAQLGEFEALQAQVSTLEKRARIDPEAGRKWRSVNDYMAREGHQAQRQIMVHVGAFESSLAKVREQLGALPLAESERMANVAPASLMRSAKKHPRNFV
ncbi:hypothetical protein EY04_27640 [Pseudomonas chlororaphis]|uniref:hypothetical protein n=1 Tax=Pseudomonas chlororaphis TaxID=587753 RepID=UPI0004AC0AA3|nr:hypothetical protein [Pseudomonas chlororaphis]AIC22548.1 hypothetical protein EY04_27640 [Pseudomonas chlororaphis]